ncbi:Meiotic nuclear division protein 1 like protein [Tupaia chinensis]|uniref:Meiotic nuclear division protein 1 like protein n=1 Tax=Tupaia chinensis TaxID=246437 RepID=L9KPA9_TUPCH|nr:Meiotic nuclear division protein 1 like protein [Tupaia chinensis]
MARSLDSVPAYGSENAFIGRAAMSVKEVLQSLVDDGMVDCERIGTSNYYWAFPSKALHARKRKLELLESQVCAVAGSRARGRVADCVAQARGSRCRCLAAPTHPLPPMGSSSGSSVSCFYSAGTSGLSPRPVFAPDISATCQAALSLQNPAGCQTRALSSALTPLSAESRRLEAAGYLSSPVLLSRLVPSVGCVYTRVPQISPFLHGSPQHPRTALPWTLLGLGPGCCLLSLPSPPPSALGAFLIPAQPQLLTKRPRPVPSHQVLRLCRAPPAPPLGQLRGVLS